MLASYHRNDAGRSEYDSDLKSWPEQMLDNPVQIKNESKAFGQIDPYVRDKSSQ